VPVYSYVARSKQNGQTVSGSIEVESRSEGVAVLRDRGLIVTELKESRKAGSRFFTSRKRSKRISVDDLVIFTRQLATIINAGLPLLEGLDILSEQMDNPSFRKVVRDVQKDVEKGDNFTDALQKHPKVFSPLFCNLIRAGESSGMLDEILRQLSIYLEKAAKLQRRVKSATIYPSVIITVAIAVVIILMVFVVPVFERIFQGFGAQLPPPTRVMIGISHFMKDYFLVIMGGLVGLFFAIRMWIKTDGGRKKFDQFLLALPIFGPLFRKIAIARFTRTFSTLLHAGVNILVSLEIVAKTSGNKVIEEAIDDMRVSIREGESIAGPLKESGVFPPMVIRMIDVGERTGALDEMLSKIADFYEDQVDVAVASLTSLMEPVSIVVLGIIIGGVVISMYMPMFKLPAIIRGAN
jgi:type IV pilus assembly protein PilC